MIILIIGPQGSGKTTIASRIEAEAKHSNYPVPYNLEVTAAEPNKEILHLLSLRQALGIKTIITYQTEGPTEKSNIPPWLMMFEKQVIWTDGPWANYILS